MKKLIILAVVVSTAALILIGGGQTAIAATTCTFTTVGSTMTLDGDCTTDATIVIPDGYTLDGAGHTITAVDPSGGHFLGAVVKNAGATAHVKKLTVTASGLANVCDPGSPTDTRLRGILFDGASGSITHNTVVDINQGASGCQEGNAIEVRNAPFDGTHPGTVTVEVAHNEISDWQKTGIVANGDVNVSIHHNAVGASATQDDLAANSIQLGFGAIGSVKHNNVDGNQWKGTSFFAASGILIFAADTVNVSQNNVGGNSDVGIFVVSDGGTYDNNRVFDEGSDHVNSSYDIGVGNYYTTTDNAITNNKVRGFDTPYDNVTDGKNKVIPGPQSF